MALIAGFNPISFKITSTRKYTKGIKKIASETLLPNNSNLKLSSDNRKIIKVDIKNV